ncbi:hypothetical protein ElyMa_000996800 [Elysia marginata]|uniref:Apple domain-containing protein n=1 Tax=Elysia marginata TaxID=1093978 RepID=A0AAV4HIV6_9GAST|nr:hypothetical protein ElyMa_000996800 [Elysia marginata]
MKVNPVRIAGIHISKDFQNIFVNAWLLSTVNAEGYVIFKKEGGRYWYFPNYDLDLPNCDADEGQNHCLKSSENLFYHSAQFEKNPKQSMERSGDATYTAIDSFNACADLCADHNDFQCNGFLYCSQSKSCRISKTEVVGGDIVSGGGLCDVYSRKP